MARKQRKANFEPFESISANSKYVRITKSMTTAAAWKALTTHAKMLYIYMKLEKYNGKPDERDISFTYEEAKEMLNMEPRTFTKARDSLIENGFLDLIEHWPYSSKPSIYGFSSRWQRYGTSDFIEQGRPKRMGAKRMEEQE